MKPKMDNRYLKICAYVVITAVVIYLAIMLINSIPAIYTTVINILSIIIKLLKPLIIGLIIAYVLYGPTNAIEKFLNSRKHVKIKSRRLSRIIGILVSYLIVIGIITGLLCGIYFMIGGQLSQNTTLTNIIEYISKYFENHTFSADGIKKQIEALNIPFMENLDKYVSEVVVWLQSFITRIMDSSVNIVIGIGSNLFSIFIAVVLSIYLLLDHEYFSLLWKKIFFIIFRNSKAGAGIRKSLTVINTTFSSYIRGQLIEALLVALLSIILLSIAQVNYALLIGIISGIFNLIPYIGPIIGTILAAIIGLLDGGFWRMFWAIVVMIIVQQLDSNVMAPRVVGQSVGLHPLFIMIAILIGGSWGGLLGMLVAVPIAASCKKLLSIWYNRHLHAEFLESEHPQEKDENPSDEQD